MGGFSANAAAALANRVWPAKGRAWRNQAAGGTTEGAGAAALWHIWHSGQVPQCDGLLSLADLAASAWPGQSVCVIGISALNAALALDLSALAAMFCIASGCCSCMSIAIASPTQLRSGSRAIIRIRMKRRIWG